MKITHIVYTVANDQVLLFLNHKKLWSGYVLEDKPDASCLGVLYIYEGLTDNPVEMILFYRNEKPLDDVNQVPKLLGPTWFSSGTPPIKEMGTIQGRVIRLVVLFSLFEGTIRYENNKRTVISDRLEIRPCTAKDIPE